MAAFPEGWRVVVHCVLLGLGLAGISPEAKFVLVRLVQLYGVGESITIGVKELAKVSGATDRVVSSALSELVAEDLLICTPIVIGRGRPKSEYRASSKLARLLENWNETSNVINRSRIDHLLHAAEERKGSLSVCNRLLLSTLLLYADQFGIVREVGVSKLSKVTGLNRERIKAQVHKLIALRVMRGVIPGVTMSVVLGVSKSVYFINFNHDVFPEGSSGTVVLTAISNARVGVGECNEVGALIESAKIGKWLRFERYKKFFGMLPDSDRFNTLARLFSSFAKNGESPRVLQVRLEEYASMLLSKHWKAFEVGEFRSDDELLMRIKKGFSQGVGSGQDPEIDNLLGELFFEFIYEIVVLMARRVQGVILSAKGFPYEIAGLQILPSFDLGGYFGLFSFGRSLLIVPHQEFRAGECYVMNRNIHGEPVCERFSDEVELSEEDRYRFGLLTKVHTPTRYRYRG